MLRSLLLLLFVTAGFFQSGSVFGADTSTVASAVQAIIDAPPDQLDYAKAKLAIDRLIDPSINADRTLSEISAMVSTVRRMLATIPPVEAKKSIERLRALQAFVYRPGPWNDNQPFQYDLDDPFGQDLSAKLLPNYLASRRGNCVSMPILFLILGERLGLDLSLSTAPLHVLVKYTDDQTGETYNLEATSGAGFTRDSWYQKKSPMTERAIENGVYLKHLSRQETLAVMATLVADHLIEMKRHEEAIAVLDVILAAYPQLAYAHVKKGTAYYHLIQSEIVSKYPDPNSLPPHLRERANYLNHQNQRAFHLAESLGWTEPTLQ